MSYRSDQEPQDIGVAPSLRIDGLAAGGRGVGRLNGVVWLVAGTLPGDLILASAGRTHPRYVEGRLLQVIEPSIQRRTAPCSLAGTCGGCPWMSLMEPEQRAWKRRLVADALSRLGGFDDLAVEEVRSAGETLGYRNKVEFTLGRTGGGKPALGLHAAGAPEGLVDVGRCLVQSDAANAVLSSAREFLLDAANEIESCFTESGEPYRLVLRSSRSTGQVLVAIRETSRPFPAAEGLARFLCERHPEISGVVRLEARPGRRGGVRTVTVIGRDWIEERIAGTTFRLPAASFVQVNPAMTEILVELVVEAAGPVAGAAILDLYGGVGVHGLALARRGARVTVCEADPAAVACGRGAAAHAGRVRACFVRADVRRFLEAEARAGRRADAIVANPPRSGFGPGVAEALAGLGPSRVVIVSCDPATLARDMRRLASRGYRPARIVPLDLFPHTAHVETVAVLLRD